VENSNYVLLDIDAPGIINVDTDTLNNNVDEININTPENNEPDEMYTGSSDNNNTDEKNTDNPNSNNQTSPSTNCSKFKIF